MGTRRFYGLKRPTRCKQPPRRKHPKSRKLYSSTVNVAAISRSRVGVEMTSLRLPKCEKHLSSDTTQFLDRLGRSYPVLPPGTKRFLDGIANSKRPTRCKKPPCRKHATPCKSSSSTESTTKSDCVATTDSFRVSEEIEVKCTDGNWYKAKLFEYDDEAEECEIHFEDGKTHEVHPDLLIRSI